MVDGGKRLQRYQQLYYCWGLEMGGWEQQEDRLECTDVRWEVRERGAWQQYPSLVVSRG